MLAPSGNAEFRGFRFSTGDSDTAQNRQVSFDQYSVRKVGSERCAITTLPWQRAVWILYRIDVKYIAARHQTTPHAYVIEAGMDCYMLPTNVEPCYSEHNSRQAVEKLV